jgi:hypothetical protein
MASISATPTPTPTPTPIVGDYSIDVKNYFNYSMVMKALLIQNYSLASTYSANYVNFLHANNATLSSKDYLIKRFNNGDATPAQLSTVMLNIARDQKDGVSIAGDILIALSHLNKWKVHSIIDNMMKTDNVSAEKVITYMKAKGYNPMLLFKY